MKYAEMSPCVLHLREEMRPATEVAPVHLIVRPPVRLDVGTYIGEWSLKDFTVEGFGEKRYSKQINSFYKRGHFHNKKLHGQGKQFFQEKKIVMVQEGEFIDGFQVNGLKIFSDNIKFADPKSDHNGFRECFGQTADDKAWYKEWDLKLFRHSIFRGPQMKTTQEDVDDYGEDLYKILFECPLSDRFNPWRDLSWERDELRNSEKGD